MATLEFVLLLIYTAQAVVGVGVTVWGAYDSRLDWLASLAARRAGAIDEYNHFRNTKTALIGLCAAIGGMIGHSLFLSLAAASLLAPPPVHPVQTTALLLAYRFGFVFMQSLMLGCQLAVQLLRRSERQSRPRGGSIR